MEIQVIKLASVNIPYVKQDLFSTDFVPYGLDTNAFLRKLNDYESYSTTHKAILNFKANMISGNGLICDEKNTKLSGALKKLNPKEYSYKTLSRIAKSYAKFNGFALQIIWSLTGQIAEIRVMDFSRVLARAPKFGENGEPKAYLYSRNWMHYTRDPYKPLLLPVYNPETYVKDGYRQIYYYYEPEDGIDFYPLPSYNAAFAHIEFEYQYAMFKVNSMKNGMHAGMHIDVVGNPEQDKKDEFYKAVKEKFSGVENVNEVIITYSAPTSTNRTVITPIQTGGNADIYTAWKEDAMQNIISAHQLSSPVLAGLAGEGGLGGNASEIAEALKQFQTTYVNDPQSCIVDVLRQLFEYKGFSPEECETIDIASLQPEIELPDWVIEEMSSEDRRTYIKDKYGITLTQEQQLPEQESNPAIPAESTGGIVKPLAG